MKLIKKHLLSETMFALWTKKAKNIMNEEINTNKRNKGAKGLRMFSANRETRVFAY